MAEAAGICAHCELPLRLNPGVEADPKTLFCCVGCRMASAMVGAGKGAVEFLEARLLLSAFLAMGVMTFSLVLYGESVYDGVDDQGANAIRGIGRLALSVFSLPVFILLGLPLLKGAWLDLKRGAIRMDGLICLATLAAYGLSLRNTFADRGEVYFDTATMVLVLVMFGRRLEAHSRTRGRDAAQFLAELLPENVQVIQPGGQRTECKPADLKIGDLVVVGPGESVPADVVVTEGRSEVVEAHITGEHRPRPIVPGTLVHAGATNGTGLFRARVTQRADEGTMGRIRQLLDSPMGMTRFMMLADRLAGYLAWVALSLAAAGGYMSYRSAGLGAGVEVALSVLLVACPCALGLATPLAYRAMRASLARRGILIRDPRALEAAAMVDKVLLDKTGTLTQTLGNLVGIPGTDKKQMQKLESLVGASNHPLAQAVLARDLQPDQLKVVPGSGVKGLIDGADCFAGSPTWMDEQGFSWHPETENERQRLLADGSTVVAFAEAGRVQALAYLAQELKTSAKEVIAGLVESNLEPEIVSGDHALAAKSIGDQLGIKAKSGLSPEGKLKHLKHFQEMGKKVLVVGDGLNDAPMLRAAEVGVAVADGTAATKSQAGVEILDDDLSHLTLLLAGARKLRQVAVGNIAWTVAYNVVALGLAVTGRLHPLAAAILMIISSMVVCTRSFGLLSFGEEVV